MKRPGQHKDESTMDYLRRVVGTLNSEHEGMLDDLKTVDAVLDFFELFAEGYGTDYWQGVLECISEGESSRKARAFIRKHKLPKSWSESIDYAMECREPQPV